MRFDKVLLFSKLTFSCDVKNKMLMQLEKDSEPIGSKYLSSKAKHGRLYRWTENSFPIFLYLKPVEISKKCFNII